MRDRSLLVKRTLRWFSYVERERVAGWVPNPDDNHPVLWRSMNISGFAGVPSKDQHIAELVMRHGRGLGVSPAESVCVVRAA